ncbi:RsmB/NOP family class I SAM-dependent RNA methyltransferase [Arcticibacter svalbardensis]|nr:RsmB/NOP family class I SAM-dependent RNA methyltransferase [Arcticibacter svalbardensis]
MTTNKYDNQLKTFLRILYAYPKSMQLARFLPGYFRENKQMGSGDRRTASRLLYNFFRLGRACSNLPEGERMVLAEFLCEGNSSLFLAHLNPELFAHADQPLAGRIAHLEQADFGFVLDDVYPFTDHFSAGIDKRAFLTSLFVQPDLFIRIHPGKESRVKKTLDLAEIKYREISESTLALPNGVKLDMLFPEIAKGTGLFEVQDLSSQHASTFFEPHQYDYWWDSCAASGGKSLNLFHQQKNIKLLVTDVRENILFNLDERFKRAGVKDYQKKIIDLTKDPTLYLNSYMFDGIILDAPCTGSGTWGRSPELISQFNSQQILTFQGLQRSIAGNLIKFLKPGKPLIYITCSVFKEENEANVEYLVKTYDLKLEKLEVIKGYERKADSMFVARLIR